MVIRKLLVLILIMVFFVIPVCAQLMDSSWAMFGMDLQHTSQSSYSNNGDGVIDWNYTTGNYIISSPAIASDGTIYVGSDDNKLYAINPNGTEKWNFVTGDWIRSSPAIASDGTIYVGSDDYKLYAINSDGTEKWNFITEDWIRSSPAIASDGTIYVGSDDNTLYAINSDGTEKWNYTTVIWDWIRSSPAIASDGTIYIGSDENTLYAINPNGTEKWNFITGVDDYIRSSPAIASDGTIYIGSNDNKLYAINSDGTEKWNYTTGNNVISSPAIASDGTIYVGSDDYKLYAINSDGTEKWNFMTGGNVISSPVIDANGIIYVGSNDHKLYAINSDGTEKWNFITEQWIHSSPAIASDGTIYVGSWDKKIYAFCPTASAASPEFDDVSWDQDPYYTGETANITTNILNFDDGTYSYYLDLYNTNDYLTTFELTSETESNYYTFPLGWTDTSLLAKLVRVTDPYATNEAQLAYDISHFETLDWDTTVSFNKSSYNPSETLKVTWSGAADGSNVWLCAGDDGEVIESDVAYSGSFTFNVPANTTETYYIVDVATGGYSQAQASCVISLVPDFFFNYSVAVDQDEYVHGDWVNVTYSTNEPAVIKVFDDTNADIWHYLDVPAAVTNETWMYYIGDTDPYGSFSVLFGNDNFLVSDYYSVVSSTSFVQVVPESMFMYDTMTIWYITNGSSTLSITDWWDSILFNQTVNSSSLESISYVPTASGKLTITLSDVPADATDSIIVYWAADPDDVPDDDDVIEDDVIEDVLDDDESMTEYFDDKFREFAPTAWGIFLLSIILWLMAILTSFGGSSKRR